jgi:signal transduction histidine kinase
MRLLIFELRPPVLERTGLAAALQARLEAVEERGGVHARLIVEGKESPRRVSPAQQQEIYHIAQEALNNVLKHARAQHVRVQLRFEETVTRLEIVDDGRGFAIDDPSGGLGLRGMRERAQRIAANLTVASTPEAGTTVTLEVPAASADRSLDADRPAGLTGGTS